MSFASRRQGFLWTFIFLAWAVFFVFFAAGAEPPEKFWQFATLFILFTVVGPCSSLIWLLSQAYEDCRQLQLQRDLLLSRLRWDEKYTRGLDVSAVLRASTAKQPFTIWIAKFHQPDLWPWESQEKRDAVDRAVAELFPWDQDLK